MERGGKKAVRFSSPFEVRPEELYNNGCSNSQQPSFQKGNVMSMSGNEDGPSPDSWDAFDAKMMRTKTKRQVKDVKTQFLELSSSQNHSINIGEKDFSALSFQDAKDLIDKDENERLQFMNSNVSFSDGIDQVEAPSLLSVTSYFQQGSSFPVPYVGNDSTMFGQSRSVLDASDSMKISNTNNQKNTYASKHSNFGNIGDLISPEATSSSATKKSDLSRNDSLSTFFLGPQSNGLNKVDIMEYVLDYCKRRASLRLSDASDIGRSLNSSTKSSRTSEKHDSGIGIGSEEKTVSSSKDSKGRSHMSGKFSSDTDFKSATRDSIKVKTALTDANDDEDSIMITHGASIKENEELDVSDVGSIDGFEKFKKNLHVRRKTNDDRYRGKVKHHADFENKRLNVDERYSHPKLSPLALSGPGATASLERPRKMLTRCSPPEKLVRTRTESIINDAPSILDAYVLGNTEGQCHSTPVAISNDSGMSKLRKEARPQPKENSVDRSEHYQSHHYKEKKLGKQATICPRSSQSVSRSSNSSDVSVCSNKKVSSTEQKRNQSRHDETNKSVDTVDCKRNKPTGQESRNDICTSVISQNIPINSNSHTHNGGAANILKQSNILPEGLSVVPVIHGAEQQHLTGNQPCTCLHHCGQQSAPHGLLPNGGLPIVIHIHLPCSTQGSGPVAHQVPASSTENRK